MTTARLDPAQHVWLSDPGLQRLMQLLESDGEEARIVGGAVRNALMGLAVSDLDISTTRLPDNVMKLMEANGIKAVPTGIEHGTVTVVIDSRPFEVTTLREDIETDGRHAVVSFGRDWNKDAERRDLTINALYCDRNGRVFDVLDQGLEDLEKRTIRFIGDPAKRIEEDYLRILRFFRFFAFYGAGRPDAEGLKACARLKDGLERLAAERVWKEFHRLLSAADPSRALLWMRQVGVLGKIMPESADWGIDLVPELIKTQADLGLEGDPMQRLMAMMRPDENRVSAFSDRLKLSKVERERLANWAEADKLSAEWSRPQVEKALYRGDRKAIIDASILELARLREKAVDDNGALHQAASLAAHIEFAIGWKRPKFPLSGKHLVGHGLKPGKEVGEMIDRLENDWVENGFAPTAEIKTLLDGESS